MESRIIPAGENAWLIELPERLDAEVNERAIGIAAAVERASLPDVTDVVVGYRSVMVYRRSAVRFAGCRRARGWTRSSQSRHRRTLCVGHKVEVPVCYGGKLRPGPRGPGRIRELFGRASHRDARECRVSRVRRRVRARLRVHGAGRSSDFSAAAHVAAAEGSCRIGCGRGGTDGCVSGRNPGRMASDRANTREAVRSHARQSVSLSSWRSGALPSDRRRRVSPIRRMWDRVE